MLLEWLPKILLYGRGQAMDVHGDRGVRGYIKLLRRRGLNLLKTLALEKGDDD